MALVFQCLIIIAICAAVVLVPIAAVTYVTRRRKRRGSGGPGGWAVVTARSIGGARPARTIARAPSPERVAAKAAQIRAQKPAPSDPEYRSTFVPSPTFLHEPSIVMMYTPEPPPPPPMALSFDPGPSYDSAGCDMGGSSSGGCD